MNRQKFYQRLTGLGLILVMLLLPIVPLYAQTTPTLPCKVANTSALNVRPGPGTEYKPVITTLARNTKVTARASNAARTFLLVDVAGKNITGWAALRYLTCTGDVKKLPVASAGSTPNTGATAGSSNNQPTASTSTAVLKPDAVYNPNQLNPTAFFNPNTGGNVPEGYEGIVEIPLSYLVAGGETPVPTFSDRLVFDVLLGRPEVPNDDSVGQVKFVLVALKADGSDGAVVHTQEEGNRPYCLFGDSDRKCNSLYLDESNVWPQSKQPLRDGSYRADITATTKDGSFLAFWQFQFEIQRAAAVTENTAPPTPTPTPPPAQASLQVELVQISAGSLDTFVDETLVFQVAAVDANVGTEDGAGIRNVDLWIYDAGGNEVYHRTENSAHYCAFQGGEPDCNVFYLWENDHWPDGPAIQGGPHTLYWRVNANDGSTQEGSVTIEVNR